MRTLKTLCTIAVLAMTTFAYASDGTKNNPYTVAELLAQKEALAVSGATVWVKADLTGLGEDGTKTVNGTDENKYECAALFADATGSFVGYSYHIFGSLSVSELTNTKDLLIALSYQTDSRPYVSDTSVEDYGMKYANFYEPTDQLHFSIAEIHGALSLEINGYRGFHIQSQYSLPEGVVAVKTTASYSSKTNEATMTYPEKTAADKYVSIKDVCVVFVARPGTYDFVLNSDIFTQWNGGALQPGKAGENTKKNSYLFRFVNADGRVGFERTCDDVGKVTLDRDDEIYLSVSANSNHFMDHWTFSDGDTKKWIEWAGIKYEDIPAGGILGDANGDGNVNAADIVEVVNYIMGNLSAGFNQANADANGDGTVNAADIVVIVNTIMKN